MLVHPFASSFLLAQGPVGTAFPRAPSGMPSDLPDPDAFQGVFAKSPRTPSGGGRLNLVLDSPGLLSLFGNLFDRRHAPLNLRLASVRLFEETLAVLPGGHPNFIWGLHRLIDLAIDPRIPWAQPALQYFHPEDDARLLRTAAMTSFMRLLPRLPEGEGREALLDKLMEFQKRAFAHLRPYFLKAPNEWNARDPRLAGRVGLDVFESALWRNVPFFLWMPNKRRALLDINQPLRRLTEEAFRRLDAPGGSDSMEHLWRRATTVRFSLAAGAYSMVTAKFVLFAGLTFVAPFFIVFRLPDPPDPVLYSPFSFLLGSLLYATAGIAVDRIRADRYADYLDRHREEIFAQIDAGEPSPTARLHGKPLQTPNDVDHLD